MIYNPLVDLINNAKNRENIILKSVKNNEVEVSVKCFYLTK